MQSQLHGIPVVKHLIRKINRDVKELGLQGAMKNIVAQSEAQLTIEGLTPEVKKVLENEAVVVVSNHPHEVDVVALFASLPKRETTSLIISSRFMHLVPNADKYLIPVYVEHHDGKSKERIQEKVFKMLHTVETFTPEEEHEKNVENIRKAGEKVKNGELVVIFPNPSKNARKKWYAGVGHILHNAQGKKPVYVVQAYIEGTSNIDYLRFIPHSAKVLTPIKITFSKPIDVSHILDTHPKEITLDLWKNYVAWVDTIKSAS